MAHERPRDRSTRAQFLTLTSVGLGGSIAAVVGVPAAGYLLAPAVAEASFTPVTLGPVSDFGGERAFAPTAAPYVEDAAQPITSAGLAYVHRTGGSNRDWLAKDAMFVVFSNRCMHLGCPVAGTGAGFQCPCHGGAYNTDGVRVAGPPIRPLDRFQWEIQKGILVITQRWSVDYVNGQLTYFPVKMPGQPVHTPGPFGDTTPNVLYPNVTYTHGPVPKPQ